ncbi:hypothetical protein BCR33DRAFT_156461 [Rhizoclosmatium globosum]|uniref:Uncharacterized protein n=1 Tax=Rhizoclosmatium globosum TaxID=329046 RepID=A0A1Y2CG01_9FUNG|nr:hypothetical protein BCR33DRAFT_156461 [Rhizoclosmatium globosum]|eukprot:ORY45961.1 hypothetical protein BCR33DRAFT_156461 [Rhizoclosmatium globosum]
MQPILNFKKATFLIHVSKCPAERPLSASLPPPNPEPDRPEPIKRKQSISSTSSRSQIQEPRRSQSPPPPPSSPPPKHEHTKEPSTSDPPPPTKWTTLIRETHPSFSFNMNAKHRRLQKRVKEFAESHQLGKGLEIPRELKDEFMAFISEELGDCLDEKCEVTGEGCEKGGEEDNVDGTRGAVKAETPDLASAAECVFSEDSKEEGKPDVKVDESKLLDSDKLSNTFR